MKNFKTFYFPKNNSQFLKKNFFYFHMNSYEFMESLMPFPELYLFYTLNSYSIGLESKKFTILISIKIYSQNTLRLPLD